MILTLSDITYSNSQIIILYNILPGLTFGDGHVRFIFIWQFKWLLKQVHFICKDTNFLNIRRGIHGEGDRSSSKKSTTE